MPDTTIESLQIELQSNSSSAEKSIDALTSALTKLKSAVKGGLGLTNVSKQLKALNSVMSAVDSKSAENIDKIANSLSKLSNLGSIKISSSIGNQLKSIVGVASQLNNTDFSGIEKISTILAPLNNIGNASGLKSTIIQLQKLPSLEKSLNKVDWTKLISRLNSLNNSLKPLANNLNKISNSFSKLSTNVNKLTKATEKSTKSNTKNSKSFLNLAGSIGIAIYSARKISSVISDCIIETNSYIENVNLFTASMGEYADSAQAYAEKVGNLMGIDPGQFMRYQGVFNTIITGFGVAGDKAQLMSKNLTQLGYDLSSFFNISFEDSMQKLQSGISGELEPLRRLGYDLSVARLQQEALNLGIEKNVNDMTQAEKSQLRYYAILTQVTVAQGDMARTLNSPANQIRVFKAQVQQLARAFGNILIPAMNAVLPYAIAIVEILREMADKIAKVAGFKLPEIKYDNVKYASSSMDNLANSTNDTNQALTNANKKIKEMKNNLLGIDELNIISPESASDTDNNNSSTSNDLGIKLPEYDFLDGLVMSNVSEIKKKIKGMLEDIAAIAGIALMGAGLVLIGFGKYGVGASLLFAGAVVEYKALKMMWSKLPKETQKMLSKVGAILGIALLGAGLVLIAFGRIGLGVGMMFAGASVLYTVASLNWKSLNDDVKNTLSTIGKVVGIPLMAVGFIIGLSGVNIPLGIAMIALGAVSLAASLALDWKSMNGDVKGALNLIGTVLGIALMGVGFILALSGAKIALGIALIAAGAVALGYSFKPIWDSLDKKTKSTINKIATIGGIALLGLGMILGLSGAAIGPGIALMVAGAGFLISAIALNWNSLSNKTKKFLNDIVEVVSGALLVLGVILAITGVALPLGIALIAVGAVGLAAEAIIHWDSIKKNVTKVLDKIKEYAGTTAMLALGVILCMTGVGIPLGVAMIAKAGYDIINESPISWDEMKKDVTEQLDKIADKFKQFSKDFKKNPVKAVVKLVKGLWDTVAGWVSKFIGGAVDIIVSLVLDEESLKSIQAHVENFIDSWVVGWKELTKGKDKTTTAGSWKDGGFFNGLSWSHWGNIPAYANGTTSAHGSLFIAGEAGAEIVGHIGGQTEVLNKSQISAAMENATVKGMSKFLDVWRVMNSQIASCTNAIIHAIIISDTIKSSAINSNEGTNYQTSDIPKSVYSENSRNYQNANGDFSNQMRDFYMNYVEPTLKEIAAETKKQADKEDKTIVQIGNREIYNAVVTQQKTDGYSFTT